MSICFTCFRISVSCTTRKWCSFRSLVFSSASLSSGDSFADDTNNPEPPLLPFFDPKYFIRLLISCKSIAQVRQVHGRMEVFGAPMYSIVSVNKLLYSYSELKFLVDARQLFDRMECKDAFSWSVMIGGYAKLGDCGNCFSVFRELIRSGFPIDNYSTPFALRACRDSVDLRVAREIHTLIFKFGLWSDLFVIAALVDVYAKCGFLEEARQLFDRMTKKDLVSWTVMIAAYADAGLANESLALFDRMKEEKILPDRVAMVTVVFACGKLGSMPKAIEVHEYITRRRFSLDVILGTAMIDMYAKCGSADVAKELFDEMPHKNVISWSSMISAYGIHGSGKKAIELFPLMISSGVQPNKITFVSILSACSHSGLLDEGRRFFYRLMPEYGIEPDVKHYTCMVDLLGRAGFLSEAHDLINGMKFSPDEGLWGALLGACKIHGNSELADKASSQLLELKPSSPGYFVLLSNIYAKDGRWDEVAKVREMMSNKSLKKKPGQSWIQIDNQTQYFSMGDTTHPQSKEIYEMLQSMTEKMEISDEYIQDTSFQPHDVEEEQEQHFINSQ